MTRTRQRRGEQLMVPHAEFESYYGRPIIHAPSWAARDIAGYFFLGGLAGRRGCRHGGAFGLRRGTFGGSGSGRGSGGGCGSGSGLRLGSDFGGDRGSGGLGYLWSGAGFWSGAGLGRGQCGRRGPGCCGGFLRGG